MFCSVVNYLREILGEYNFKNMQRSNVPSSVPSGAVISSLYTKEVFFGAILGQQQQKIISVYIFSLDLACVFLLGEGGFRGGGKMLLLAESQACVHIVLGLEPKVDCVRDTVLARQSGWSACFCAFGGWDVGSVDVLELSAYKSTDNCQFFSALCGFGWR